MNSFPTDTPETMANISIGIDGGIIIPTVEEATVMPVENSFEYPCLVMSGMRIDPSAEVSATDDPVIPPNIIEATTLTSPRPPLKGLQISSAKLMSLFVSPPWFMSSPESMKSGIAMRMNEFSPANTRWGTLIRNEGFSIRKYIIPAPPRE